MIANNTSTQPLQRVDSMQEQIIRDNNRVINEVKGIIKDPAELRALMLHTS
jgi:hypothetical protein